MRRVVINFGKSCKLLRSCEPTITLLPGSSALLQTPDCSEYHPSEQSPVVIVLSLTRLHLSGTNSQFLSVILPLSVLSNRP